MLQYIAVIGVRRAVWALKIKIFNSTQSVRRVEVDGVALKILILLCTGARYPSECRPDLTPVK